MKEDDARIFVVVVVVIAIVAAVGIHAYDVHKRDTAYVAPPPANSQTTSPSSSASTPATTTPAQSTPTTSTPAPSTPSCYTASQASSEEGQTGCVQFTGYAYTSDSGQMYLDQSTSAPYGFSVWIPAGTSGGSSWLSEYSGQNIDVTGAITNYNGEPEIEVTSASQITAVQ